MGRSEGKFDVRTLSEEPAWEITAGADSKVLNNAYECSLSAVDQDTTNGGLLQTGDKTLTAYNELTICLPAEQPSVSHQYICTTELCF